MMVFVVREFIRTRDPLIRDLPIRDPLNTYTPIVRGYRTSSKMLRVFRIPLLLLII